MGDIFNTAIVAGKLWIGFKPLIKAYITFVWRDLILGRGRCTNPSHIAKGSHIEKFLYISHVANTVNDNGIEIIIITIRINIFVMAFSYTYCYNEGQRHMLCINFHYDVLLHYMYLHFITMVILRPWCDQKYDYTDVSPVLSQTQNYLIIMSKLNMHFFISTM